MDKQILEIRIFLDNLWQNDEKSKEILEEANLTTAQQKLISTMIATGLQAYHEAFHKKH